MNSKRGEDEAGPGQAACPGPARGAGYSCMPWSTWLRLCLRIFGVTKTSSSLLVVDLLGILEQMPDQGQAAEERHAVDAVRVGVLEHAAEDHGLAVVDQHLGGDLPGVDAGHAQEHGPDGVLGHLQVHHDAVVGGDLRRDLQAQGRLLERDRGRAAGGRLLIGDLHALLDEGLALVGGDHPRAGDDLAAALGLQGGQLQVQQVVLAQDGEGHIGGVGVHHRQIHVEAVRLGRERWPASRPRRRAACRRR